MIWVFPGQKKRKNETNFDPAMDKLLKKSCSCSKYGRFHRVDVVWDFKFFKEKNPDFKFFKENKDLAVILSQLNRCKFSRR